ncbi:MAG TPA: hypothetical protein VNB06_03070 [Thermoanaerobaculia bacterium]|nr:hypothetical protein [Thermoanaerobaculia bacterium]
MNGDAHDSIELERLARRHALLQRQAERTPATDPSAVLELGASVLVHRGLQVASAVRSLSWLDPAVLARVGEEQDQLGQDLELLRELLESVPGSADAIVLAGALLDRLRQHLHHDERVLQRPLQRLLALGATPATPGAHPGGRQTSRRGEAS